jgi:uncharacterized membrane protein YbaN (DUF454 family)
MTRKTKIRVLVPATVLLAAAAVMVPSLPVRIMMAILIAAKYYFFIFRIKTGTSVKGGGGCD